MSYDHPMTALAIIEQIKALPPEEQIQVIHFLEEAKLARAVRTMPPETFETSAQRIFGRHVELMDRLSQVSS